MMEGTEGRSQKGLIAAIIFASLVVSGSLVFLGMQMSGTGLSANIAENDGEMEKLLAELKALGVDAEPETSLTTSREELFDDDAFIGDEDAPVAVIEFSDYQCPFCNRHFTQTFSQIKKEYVDTGKLAYVYRDFPLSFHYDALPAAVAAECVREQKGDAAYFQMHEKIFTGVASTGTIPQESLRRYASQVGVNMSKFETCLTSPEKEDEVNADMAAGSQYGISGTPGFVITNGKTSKIISGAQPYAAFKKEIDAMLQ
ncbi:MAG: DsbA family protein [Candidatus Altimarinota bacterium]